MHPRGVCRRVLKSRQAWEGPLGKAAAANRTREIRLSGMRGGPVETWAMAELGTRGTIERVPVGHSRLRLRAPYFYPTLKTIPPGATTVFKGRWPTSDMKSRIRPSETSNIGSKKTESNRCRRGSGKVVIEHNLDIIREADCIVDLGPEGGEKGGRLVAWGPVGKVIRSRRSHTARYLREHLSKHSEPR